MRVEDDNRRTDGRSCCFMGKRALGYQIVIQWQTATCHGRESRDAAQENAGRLFSYTPHMAFST